MAFIRNKILIVKILLSGICLLFLAVTFHTENRSSGWYQQFLPTNLPNFLVSDIFFLDSLNGWLVTGNSAPYDTSGYILKTTNGGNNWVLKFIEIRDFTRVKFINLNTGFVCGGYNNGARLYKTTTGGDNWFSLNIPGGDQIIFNDMSVLNEDTIWLVANESLIGGVFYTSNGGLSWTQQFSGGTENPNKIYMYNARIGFICNNTNNSSMKKTTNGGQNWFPVLTSGSFRDLLFVDSLTGWRTMDFINKTTNGGLNWFDQPIPRPNEIYWGIRKLTSINKDTIWGSYASYFYPNMQSRGVLYRTINGGTNWFYQIPDTSFQITQYPYLQFINKNIGWAYTPGGGIHTFTGGDTVFYMGIQKISKEIPQNYILHQNYPNPFNPRTVIGYEIKKNSFVRMDAYDILGKQVMVLVNEKQSAGKYEVDFMGKFSPSGIYFYRLMADGKVIDTKKMMLVK